MAWSLIEAIDQHNGLLNAKEVQQITGWSRAKIYRLMDNGIIPTINLGCGTRTDRQVDPKTWKHFLLSADPKLRAAQRG